MKTNMHNQDEEEDEEEISDLETENEEGKNPPVKGKKGGRETENEEGNTPPTPEDHLKSSSIRSSLNIMKSVLGAGSLVLPYSFALVGLTAGITSIAIIGFINCYASLILARCYRRLNQKIVKDQTIQANGRSQFRGSDHSVESVDDIRIIYPHDEEKMPMIPPLNQKAQGDDHRKSNNPFTQLAYAAFGKYMQWAVDLTFMLNMGGACSIYLIFVETTMVTVVPELPQWVWVLISLPILIPISWLKSLSFLAIPSLVGNIAVLVAYLCVLGYGLSEYGFNLTLDDMAVKWDGIAEFFGLILFAYGLPLIAIMVLDSMKTPQDYSLIMIGGTVTISLFYGLLGIVGFGVFKEAEGGPQSNIILNLPEGSIYSTIVKSCMSLVLLATFPLAHFIFASSVETYTLKNPESWWRPIQRTILVLIPASIAIGLPSFSGVINVIGSFTSAFLSFLLPPLIFLRLCWADVNKFEIGFNFLLALFGLGAWIFCTTLSIIQLIDEF